MENTESNTKDYESLAMQIAAMLHSGQVRKYTGEPYVWHCIEVANILRGRGYVGDIVCAALLHDVIEDTEMSAREMRALFPDSIVSLVLEVTDISTTLDGNREKRKNIDRDHLSMASAHGQTIKLADLISNTKSIVAHDRNFAKVYLKEKQKLLEVLTKGDKILWSRAQAQLLEAQELIKE